MDYDKFVLRLDALKHTWVGQVAALAAVLAGYRILERVWRQSLPELIIVSVATLFWNWRRWFYGEKLVYPRNPN